MKNWESEQKNIAIEWNKWKIPLRKQSNSIEKDVIALKQPI